MPELTCTKLVIYLDIQLFLIGKSPFCLQDTALLAPPNVICNVHLPNAFAKQTSETTLPHGQTTRAERGGKPHYARHDVPPFMPFVSALLRYIFCPPYTLYDIFWASHLFFAFVSPLG